MTELERGRGSSGVVADFDAVVGLGSIERSDGLRFEFHCIEIADGSREIGIGTRVSFDVLAKFGRYEAANIRQ